MSGAKRMNLVELAKLYDQKGYYARERRPFRRKPWLIGWLKPDVRPLEPLRRHQVYGRRTGLKDRLQCTFGYFFGGGWVFGLVENRRFRAGSAGLKSYETSGDRILPWRAGDIDGSEVKSADWPVGDPLPKLSKLPKEAYLTLRLHRDAVGTADPLPALEHLQEMDRLALVHDRDLREIDEQVWNKALEPSSVRWREARQKVNGALLQGLEAIDWAALRKDWMAAETELPRKLWHGMGSLFAYQMCLALFSIKALSLPGVSAEDDYLRMGHGGPNQPELRTSEKTFNTLQKNAERFFDPRYTDVKDPQA